MAHNNNPSNSSVNFTSQRISFVNKIGLILKATADDEVPIPGYMYKEVNNISFESVGYSESLVEFLVDRLKNKSMHVKFKVLKLMKHVTENGSREFQLGLRKHSDTIKEYTKFGGPPHPLHGNAPYMLIRNVATELCELLYNMDPTVTSPGNRAGQDQLPDPKYGGLGPVRSGGAIQGFGNKPLCEPKGFTETLRDGIEKLGAKMSETGTDRQAMLLARLDLSGSSSNYQPPVVDVSQLDASLVRGGGLEPGVSAQVFPQIKKTVKKHQPGKAGGGWSDDDEEEEEEENHNKDEDANSASCSKVQSFETDSLADQSSRLCLNDQEDWSEEDDLVTEILKLSVPGGGAIKFLTNTQVTSFLSKCHRLSTGRIVEVLAQKLTLSSPDVIAKSLQLLEGIIYNREELINLDLLAASCKESLVTCYQSCSTRRMEWSQQTAADQSPDTEGTLKNPWTSVQAKTAKVILILQQLSSHKDILHPASFSDVFQPKSQVSSKSAS